jgi:hypothetical protein
MGVLKARVGGAWVAVAQGVPVGGWVAEVKLAANYQRDAAVEGTGFIMLPGMTVSWTADPTRRYKTTAYCSLYNSGAVSSQCRIDIYDTAGAGRQCNVGYNWLRGVGDANNPTTTAEVGNITVIALESGLSGPQTRQMRAGNLAANAKMFFSGTPTWYCFLLVEDIGAV